MTTDSVGGGAARLASEHHEVPDTLEAIEFYYRQGWTDGLPVVPPTPEAVEKLLDAASLAPDQILGVEPTKGAVITVCSRSRRASCRAVSAASTALRALVLSASARSSLA